MYPSEKSKTIVKVLGENGKYWEDFCLFLIYVVANLDGCQLAIKT